MHGAAAGAVGAFVAETVAEAAADQKALFIAHEYVDSCVRKGATPTAAGYEIYRTEALETVGEMSKVAGAVGALLGRLDPNVAFRTAENAIENNFFFLAPWVYAAAAGGLGALKVYDVVKTSADAADAYEKGGAEGLWWFMAEEGAVRYAFGRAGRAVVFVGDKAFGSAKKAAAALLARNPAFAEKSSAVGADLAAITHGLEQRLRHAMQDYAGVGAGAVGTVGAAGVAGAKVAGAGAVGTVGAAGVGAGKVTAKGVADVATTKGTPARTFTKAPDATPAPVKKTTVTEKSTIKKEIPVDTSKDNSKLMGEYRHVRGHHIHAKKAFEGHVNYDPKKGFSISNEYMKELGIDHMKVTAVQRKLFNELARSGRMNTMKEHTRIAVDALVEGSGGMVTKLEARRIVAESLSALRAAKVTKPTTIPWN